jgi:carbamoyltransferase
VKSLIRQLYEYHPVIGFRFIPGLKTRVLHEGGGYLVQVNETGFRSKHAFEKKKKPGIRRILLFGDSYTAGDGVSNGKRFGDHLESLMSNVEVYNFGLPATGTDQHYLIFQEYARDIEHDLLIIAVFVENIRRVSSRYRHFVNDKGKVVLYAKPYFTYENDKLELKGVPPPKQPIDEGSLAHEERKQIFTGVRFPRLKKVYNKLRNNSRFENLAVKSGLKAKMVKLLDYQPLVEYDDPQFPGWLTMQAVIREWTIANPEPTMLIPVPLYHYVAELSDPTNYETRFREAVMAAGGLFCNPLTGLQAYSQEEQRSFFYDKDGHLTNAGHEAFAKCIVRKIEQVLDGSEGEIE